MNFRKGDLVEVNSLVHDFENVEIAGLVISTKGAVAEVHYPNLSGCIWIPFDLLTLVKASNEKLQ